MYGYQVIASGEEEKEGMGRSTCRLFRPFSHQTPATQVDRFTYNNRLALGTVEYRTKKMEKVSEISACGYKGDKGEQGSVSPNWMDGAVCAMTGFGNFDANVGI